MPGKRSSADIQREAETEGRGSPTQRVTKREASPETILSELTQFTYFDTNTRMLGILVHEPTELVLEHPSRKEALDEAEIVLGFDLSPKGTCPMLKQGERMPRRIGAAAVNGVAWGVDKETQAELGDRMKILFDEAVAEIALQSNDSYKQAASLMVELIRDGKAELCCYRPHCGIKVTDNRAIDSRNDVTT